jgi:hypothetical protein
MALRFGIGQHEQTVGSHHSTDRQSALSQRIVNSV